MLVFGFHPVREVLRNRPHDVIRILIAGSRRSRRRLEIEGLCRRHGVELSEVTEGELTKRCEGVHNGFAAEVVESKAEPADVRSDSNLVVLLEDIQDPRNLGALLRVCEGAGVGEVAIRDRGSAPITPTVVKAAAGATEWLAVERVTNSAATIDRWKQAGFWVCGADAAGIPPWRVDLTGKIVLCFGGEERGLRARTRKLCDHLVGLPMPGHVESLNVATAAAAVIYEALRQRSGDSEE